MNTLRYIEAPAEHVTNAPSVFLAGGITDAENWQPEMAQRLAHPGLTVVNPRQRAFSGRPVAAEEQTKWEFRHIGKASAMLFWFPPQTLCPIALYELGRASATSVPLFVGVHPDYQRKRDVVIQLGLARPDVDVVFAQADLAQQVLHWADEVLP